MQWIPFEQIFCRGKFPSHRADAWKEVSRKLAMGFYLTFVTLGIMAAYRINLLFIPAP